MAGTICDYKKSWAVRLSHLGKWGEKDLTYKFTKEIKSPGIQSGRRRK